MNIRHYILTLIFAAVSIAAGAQNGAHIEINGSDASDANNPISKDIETVNVDNVKFTEPTPTVVNDQGVAITSQYNLAYYIKGSEDNIKKMRNPLGTSTELEDMSFDDANLWYIEVKSGNFFTGKYSGTATIHIVATPREGTGTLDGYYNVTVKELPTSLSIYPTEITVYKDFKFQLPTAKVKFGSEDITEYFDTDNARKIPNEFTASKSDKEIVSCSKPGKYEITWDFKGKTVDGIDYSRHYAEVKDTVKVTVLDAVAPSGKIPVTMEWEGTASQTAPKKDSGFDPITLPFPHVNETVITKDKKGKDVEHSVLANNLFRYKYEIVSVTDNNGNEIAESSSDYPTLSTGTGDDKGKSWTITPKALGTINLRVTNMDSLLDSNGELQAPTGYEQATETYVIYVADQVVTVTLNPDEASIPGSWVITRQVWSLPKYSATREDNDFTSSATWFIGLPDGTVTTFDKDPDLSGGEQRTVDDVLYQFYPIIRDFADGDTIDITNVPADNRKIMFWAKPTDTSLGDGGFAAQTLTQSEFLKPVLTPTYNDAVANLKEEDNNVWSLQPFHTPNLKITSSTGVDISEHYNITYHLDKDALAAGFTIDSKSGQLSYSYTGTTPNTDTRTITYIVTPKTTPTIYGTDSTTVTIHPAKATYSYETLTTEGSNFGKIHFTAAGEMASGTRINAVPGLDVMFGKVGGTAWQVMESSSDKDDAQDGYPGEKVLITDGGRVTVDENSIPTDGTFYVLLPYVSGKVTIDANFATGATYTMIGSNSYKKTYDGTDNYDKMITWDNVLIAGVTYYLYCSKRNDAKTATNGLDDGELHLHGINFTPCYVTSQEDTEATTTGTIFTNSSSSSSARIIDSPSSYVTFAVKDDGIDYTPYVSVNAETGVVTGKSNSRVLKSGRVPIVVTIKNDELGENLVKTAEIDLLVTSIPSFAVSRGQSFDAGIELHPSVTENGITTVNTDITVTIGGWNGKYNRSGDKTDTFKAAETDESGDNGGIIDGFRFRSFGANDTYDENVQLFNRNVPIGQHSSFELPVMGTFLKVESQKTGTVNVYLCHNGIVDYVGTDLETIKREQPQMTQMKWRPLFITDETGNVITPTDIETNSTLKVAYNDPRVKNYAVNNPYENLNNGKAVFLDSFLNSEEKNDYGGCSFSFYRFGNTDAKRGPLNLNEQYILDDAKTIVKAWKNMTVGQKQQIIKLQQGYCTINKAFVRYTFRVYPGKSYFIWMTGSKPGLAGFTFIPDEYLTEKTTTAPDIDMSDYEDEATKEYTTADKFYAKVTAKVNKAEKVSDDDPDTYPDFNVNIKRRFGTDKWTSICLPFSISEEKFAEAFGKNALIMTYDSITPIEGSNDRFVVHLVQHTKKMIEANRPYFIRPSKTMSDDANTGVTINGVTIQSDYGKLPSANGEQSGDGTLVISDQKDQSDIVNENGHTQVGTLATVTAPAKSFVMAGTRLYHVTKDYAVPPFRSFIKPNGTDASSGAKTASFDTEIYDVATQTYLDIGDTPTGIEGVEDDGIEDFQHGSHIVHGVFNLAGQKVAESLSDHLPRGIYIVEGKKVVVR